MHVINYCSSSLSKSSKSESVIAASVIAVSCHCLQHKISLPMFFSSLGSCEDPMLVYFSVIAVRGGNVWVKLFNIRVLLTYHQCSTKSVTT